MAAKKAVKKATKKKAAKAKRAPVRRAGTSSTPFVRVRMYRQGLGDCFLLTFYTAQTPVHMLIDFGSIGEKTTGVTVVDVAKDIVAETGGRLHLMVATHEHQDHVNGFFKQRALLDSPGFKVDRVWQAWTEDGTDEEAQKLETRRGDLLRYAMAAAGAAVAAGRPQKEVVRTVDQIVRFVGSPTSGGELLGAKELAQSVQEAMSWVTNRANNTDKFLRPGMVLEPAWLPGIRFYVLGPPRDQAAINRLGDHGDEELYGLTHRAGADLETCAQFAAAGQGFTDYMSALDGDRRAAFVRANAFDPRFRVEAKDTKRVKALYGTYETADAWRRLDVDWVGQASDLALQLDNATNNTSLVLAIELVQDGRVLLFPGDAQKGNWQSWEDYDFQVDGANSPIKASDLLARTALYKVGHHSSHNATLKGKGLELMRRKDLVAMIPLDADVASNKWPSAEWPAAILYEALLERTKGRVLRSDTGWPAPSLRPAGVPKTEWDGARRAVEDGRIVDVQPNYIDYFLR